MGCKDTALIIIAVAAAVMLLLSLFFIIGFIAINKAWEHIMRDWENRDR